MNKALFLSLFFTVCLGLGPLQAQLVQVPIGNAVGKPAFKKSKQTLRLEDDGVGEENPEENEEEPDAKPEQEIDTLALPFWDDFSTVLDGIPDQEKWIGKNIRITDGIGVHPPSINVASFDGVDQFGNPYSANTLSQGTGDALESFPIDLSGLSSSDFVNFSFFWQIQGKGERPDDTDKLELYFLDKDTVWHKVWPVGEVNYAADETIKPDVFTQEVIPVELAKYFHKGFKFKFQYVGNQSGPFDHWHVDYIYLNKNRKSTEQGVPESTALTNHFDQTIITKPGSIFNGYTAIPTFQFFNKEGAYASEYLKTPEAWITNLNIMDKSTTVPYAVSLKKEGVEIMDLLKEKAASNRNKILLKQEIYNVLSEYTLDENEFLEKTFNLIGKDVNYEDSLLLELEIAITPENTHPLHAPDNTFYPEDVKVDFKVNDIATSNILFYDYFAYDDGQAEYGAGVNQQFGQIAYEFELKERDLITHIDIYFPTIGKSQSGAPIELFVLKRLGNNIGDFYIKQQATVMNTGSIDGFNSYQLSSPVMIEKGKFYIGFEQSTTEFIAIGLDKNNDTGQKIFYNVDGRTWIQNEDGDHGIRGSLMMRPRFSKKLENPNSVSPDLQVQQKVIAYPNPTKGQLTLKGEFEHLIIRDLWGREVLRKENKTRENIHHLDLSNCNKGIYILHLSGKNLKQTEKIVIEQ